MSQNLTLEFSENEILPLLFGEHSAHLKYIENKTGVSISDRGNTLTLSGTKREVKTAQTILDILQNKIHAGHEVGTAEIDAALRFLDSGTTKPTKKKAAALGDERLAIKTKKKTIIPRSPNQAAYIEAIINHEMVFGLGPAGTGKTYLAVAMAVSMYLSGEVERLIFCRPAVEAGEQLGFLPGDMKDKVDPYLRPIYDALHDMLPADFTQAKIEAGDIEIAPLAFMRGRTLSNAFVLVDEAQNTTTTQMKMLLTRLGESSRMVVNGDMSQIDLPRGAKSGLRDAVEVLDGIKDIPFMRFEKADVTRHALVGKIIDAYDKQKRKEND